ncbi:MAG: 30S ribosomal protein S6 [candidate division WOR-3 bacterium]
MNHYELVLILNPTLSDSEVQKLSEELRDMLTRTGATEVDATRSERRTLAYPIRKQNEGIYLYIRFTGPATIPANVQTELKHRDEILRLRCLRAHHVTIPSPPCDESPVSEPTVEPTDG